LLNLKQILEAFVRHRREVVTRRTIFELRKARARAHILEGLTVALANIDEMIELIKTSANPNEARERLLARRWNAGLVASLLAAAGSDASKPEDLPQGVGLLDDGYQLTEVQAKEILEMRLHRLTGLEQDRLTDEYKTLLETIRGLIEILENPDRLREVIRDELKDIKDEYGDARRSEIRASEEDLDILDLIAPEDVVVTLSHAGYVKRQPVTAYRAQKRGGRGRNAAATKDEDFIDQLWLVNTHDTLLTFTSSGRVFWLPVHQLPDAGPNARGRPIVNWLALEPGEKIQAVVPVHQYDEQHFVFFATRSGTVKKTPLTEFAYRLARGKIAINLDEGDALIGASLTDGARDILLFASNGRVARFSEAHVRPMGRTATGVRGMRLQDGETVVSLIVAEAAGEVPDEDALAEANGVEIPEQEADVPQEGADAEVAVVLQDDGSTFYILTATENGFGKRTPLADHPRKGRGTQGVIGIQTTARNGRLVGAVLLRSADEVLLISDGGTLVRTRAAEISQVGRNTQGVTLMRLSEGEHLQALERLDGSLVDDENADPASPPIMPVDVPADVIVNASSDAPQPDANA
jgi:DNA gyrase subunit A